MTRRNDLERWPLMNADQRKPLGRNLIVALAAAFVALGFAGCGGDDGAANTVTVGVVAPLDAGLTQFGLGIRNSVQLAVDEANAANAIPGWHIAVRAVDDSSDPNVGQRNAEQLVDDPTVIGVVGTYNSGVARVVAPELESAAIAMLSPGNTDPSLTIGPVRNAPVRQFDNYFRMVANDSQQGGFLAAYAAGDLGIVRVAVITDEKQVSQGLANDFRAAFVVLGGTVVSFEVVPEGDTDYGPYVQRAASLDPELLFFGGEYDHAALVKQAAIANNLFVPLMGGDGIQADDYITLAGAISEGDLASSVGAPVEREPNGPKFLAAYTAHGFAEPPSTFGPYAYDAANIILSAARDALSGKSRVDTGARIAVIDGVEAVTNAELFTEAITGTVGFDAFGDTVHPVLTVYRVEDGVWRPLVTRTVD